MEADEMFIERINRVPAKRSYHHKMKVFALVDHDSGYPRTMVIDAVNAREIISTIRANVARERAS